MEDEGCSQETYAQLWDWSQATVPSSDPAQYTQNNQRSCDNPTQLILRKFRNIKDPRNREVGGRDRTYIMTKHCGITSSANIKRVWCKFKFRKLG